MIPKIKTRIFSIAIIILLSFQFAHGNKIAHDVLIYGYYMLTISGSNYVHYIDQYRGNKFLCRSGNIHRTGEPNSSG